MPNPFDDSTDGMLPDWAPSLEAIGSLVPEHTRARTFDSPPGSTPGQLTFTEQTKPTAEEVTGWIVHAVTEVVARSGARLETVSRFPELAQMTAAWLVVMEIERSLGNRARMEDAEGARSTAERQYVGLLNDLKARAGRATPGLI